MQRKTPLTALNRARHEQARILGESSMKGCGSTREGGLLAVHAV
jgi:hypothetical protein